MPFAIIVLYAVAQIILGLFVFLKRRNSLTNILFGLLSIATLGWVLASYLSITSLNSANLIHIVRFILFFVIIQNTFFYLFSRTFPNATWIHSKKWLLAYIFLTITAAFFTLSPYVFISVTVKDGIATSKAGPAIMVFILHAIISISWAFKDLIKKARKARGAEKNQLQLLIIASALNWAVVPITNFIVTAIFKTTFFIVISPIYTLVFIGVIAYTIVSQKLFDIRAAVTRSVVYVLSVGSIVVMYSVATIGIANYVFRGSANEKIRAISTIILAGVLAISFQNIKSFFDQITKKLFYRDAYESQQLLDELNKVLISTIELDILLKKSAEIIGNTLKSEFCIFAIKEIKNTPQRVVGTSHKFATEDMDMLRGITPKIHQKIIVADELEEQEELKSLLRKYDISIVGRISESSDQHVEGLGYLILGPKKSGSIYSEQDTRIIETITDELVIAIQNALRFEEIQQFNITLQQKIDDATHQLRKANDKLRALDETKDEFISMASHQLRTPLTSVKGYVSMVLEGDAGKVSSPQKKLLDQAFLSSQRMVYLIADLLNVSRLRTGKFVIDAQPTNLADLVEGEINQLTETAKGRGLELTFVKPKDFPTLMLDETKTRQVIMNFADNAIYYTPSGGHISVNLVETPESVELTVVDDGLGVPKHDQHYMFTKFYRAGNAKKARPDGTGLGLFMAKKVIIAQGGAIIFKSEEGKGSTFGFSFPKAKLKVQGVSDKAK